MTSVLVTTLIVAVIGVVMLWIVSLIVTDVSIVDIYWGLGFVVIAWVALISAPTTSPRGWLACGLVTAWGVRLATHLAIRNLGHGEDYRYRAMRAHHGAWFPIISLGTVFLLQAVLMWIVSLPVQVVHVSPGPPLGWLDAMGVVLWGVGLMFETVADAQLARFKQPPENRGQVMDRGLWRYSRHPNYFGDFLVWWGFGLMSVAAGAPWTLIGPVVMTVLLLKVSGVALLESTIAERRPAYRDYVARTSAFLPWPPKRRPGL